MDYKNGKIYRLVCEETGRQYIGSTCTTLVKRLHNHNKKTNNCTSRHLINPKIFLIQDYPCDRKEQLTARERHFIETMDCVNVQKPGRTKYEWYKDNREQILEYKKEWREENSDYLKEKSKKYREQNRETINEKQNEKINCECGCIVARANMSRHKQSKKHNKLIKLI